MTRTDRLVGRLLGLSLLVLTGTAVYLVAQQRADVWRQAHQSLSRVAAGLESATSARLAQTVYSLRGVCSDLTEAPLSPVRSEAVLHNAMRFDPESSHLGVLAVGATPAVIDHGGTQLSAAAARAVQEHVGDPTERPLDLRPPLKLAGSAEWYIPVVLQCKTPGVTAVGLVEARTLLVGAATLSVLPESFVTLVRSDGTRILRYYQDRDGFEIGGPAIPRYRLDWLRSGRVGSYEADNFVTGKPQVVGYAKSEALPMYIGAIIPASVLQRQWLDTARGALLVLAFAVSAVVIFGVRLRRSMLNQQVAIEKATEASAQAEAGFVRFQRLFNAAPTIMLVIRESDERVVEVNEAYCQLHGLGRDQILNHSTRELGIALREGDRLRAMEVYRRDGRLRNMEVEGTLRSGDQVTMLLTAEPLEYAGEACRLVIGTDITAIKHALQARTAAEAANEAKSSFLANMSHEIRTPINAVLGLTDLVLRTPLDAQQRNYLNNTHLAAKALLQLVDGVLDFSKLESRRLELDAVAFDLDDLLAQVVAVVQTRAQQKSLALRCTVGQGVPRHLIGDEQRLRQVLTNLCGNAVKFTHVGEVELAVELSQDAAATGRSRLTWSVRDTGIGLGELEAARIFQPFVQADASTARRYGGTGLGLAISKQLVELMGGQLELSSTLGVGSRFFFTIELGLSDGRADNFAAAAPALQAAPTLVLDALRGRRVLLVEDNELNQLVAGDLLGNVAGMHVTIAGDGLAALDALRSGRFDAMLCDVQMPDMDGYELTRRVRAHGAWAKLPIVAVTAHASTKDRQLCLSAGMDDYLSKPFDPQQLFRVLAGVLSKAAVRPVDSVSPGAAALAGVSIPLGLERCLGRHELYQKLVRRFLSDHARLPERIRDAQAHGLTDQAATLAHNLISTAGTLGALRLCELAREIERSLHASDLNAFKRLIDAADHEHAAVKADLADYLQAFDLPDAVGSA